MTKLTINNTTLELIQGDITELEVDAIVSPSNCQLILGAGVAGAVASKGGASIQEECNRIARVDVGEAAITGGGNLKAKHVIHAVGPRMGEGDEENKLANATLNSLKLAQKQQLKSIAFPAISTGIFGFPMGRCAEVMLGKTVQYIRQGSTTLERVIYCLFDADSLRTFKKTLSKLTREQPD